MFRRILGTAAAAVAMTASVSAADLSSGGGYKDGYIPFSWTGFYIGAGAGPSYGHTGYHNVGTPTESGAFSSDHAFASAQGGYNFQSGHIVYGIEGDVGYLDLTSSKAGTLIGSPNSYGATGGAYADLTGRVGFVLPRTLIYGKGGVAFTEFKGTVLTPTPFSKSDSLTGWTAGGGIEFLLLPKWTVKFEYMHSEFGDTTSFTDGGSKVHFDPSVDTFKFGFNYLVRGGYESLK
jgi:outer membrane immunogenic protein